MHPGPSEELSSPSPEATQAKNNSILLGILGIFSLGLILGPLAIMQAKKAERFGESATAGKILGIIGILSAATSVTLFLLRHLG